VAVSDALAVQAMYQVLDVFPAGFEQPDCDSVRPRGGARDSNRIPFNFFQGQGVVPF
jgi:hypothetical protein